MDSVRRLLTIVRRRLGVLAVLVIAAAVVAIVVVGLTSSPTQALLLALVLFAIAGLVATGYLWLRFYRDSRRPRSRFLLTVCVGSTLIEIGSSVIAVLATRRLMGFESLPFALQATILSLLLIELVPIIFAVVIWLVRRHRLPNRPVVDPDGER